MLQRLIILVIKIYKYALSGFLGAHCRFYPTCSTYSQQAIEHLGVCRGLWLCCKRLCRCHPWCRGGYDPVPNL